MDTTLRQLYSKSFSERAPYGIEETGRREDAIRNGRLGITAVIQEYDELFDEPVGSDMEEIYDLHNLFFMTDRWSLERNGETATEATYALSLYGFFSPEVEFGYKVLENGNPNPSLLDFDTENLIEEVSSHMQFVDGNIRFTDNKIYRIFREIPLHKAVKKDELYKQIVDEVSAHPKPHQVPIVDLSPKV